MEIQEITFFYLYEGTKQIEVSFRLTTDSEDEIRNDVINLGEAKEFGYDLIQEPLYFYDDNEEFEEDEEEFQTVDEDLLLSFLNEYYVINPNKLPKTEFL
jgi:hypothetical protein